VDVIESQEGAFARPRMRMRSAVVNWEMPALPPPPPINPGGIIEPGFGRKLFGDNAGGLEALSADEVSAMASGLQSVSAEAGF
jgi:hypothetical protein